MVPTTKVSSLITTSTGREPTGGLTVVNSQVIGATTRCMEKEYSGGVMAGGTKAST